MPESVFNKFEAIATLKYLAKREVTLITFTCSKLTIETLEKGVKYVQS